MSKHRYIITGALILAYCVGRLTALDEPLRIQRQIGVLYVICTGFLIPFYYLFVMKPKN